MRHPPCPLPPSSSLPPLRRLDDLAEDGVFAALENLSAIYRPAVASVAQKLAASKHQPPDADALVDSGYTSATEDDDHDDARNALDALRADDYERGVAERWLTGLIARVEELECFASEESRARALDEASDVLESFYTAPATADEPDDDEFSRDFSFNLAVPGANEPVPVAVRLNDGLAGKNSADPDDVGLQSWSASIVFSDLLCANPDHFGLGIRSQPSPLRIVELGAGTGLVGLVVGKMLPHLGLEGSKVVATDYHPAVLANLRANVAANFSSLATAPVDACLLDWAAPSFEAPLDIPADVLIATDVVYAHEHAVWLRDCATQMLAPTGVFWLLITVRQKGRFEDVHVCETVEAAFSAQDKPHGADGRVLSVLRTERLEKRAGLGRGDESGYQMFMIGWEETGTSRR
ncbi:putative methyltransferase-domain-containing protein [Plectosphaerella plurivora]|uniref:Methyltransferase-domain-containing protein n=1 Tax=Plectosphaerella plurivora TaxID=936078 RepID=A0A9P8VKD1_9PEZI|nr:putative methyltransferase-domain-containing protein [Plectosphaerella plurivora]